MLINNLFKTITLKDYCKSNNCLYKVIVERYMQKLYIPIYYENSNIYNSIKYEEYEYPEIYLCELHDMNLLGNQSIIFDDNGYCLYDSPFRDNENRYNLNCANTIYSNSDKTLLAYEDSKIDEIEEGIMLVSNASGNYYHLNIEIFSKLCLINTLDEYKNTPIIVDAIVKTIPQFTEELEILNKNNRKVYYIERDYITKVKKLIYVSDLVIGPLNLVFDAELRYEDVIISDVGPNLLNNNLLLKSNFVEKLFNIKKPAKKLYMARHEGEYKRLVNYEEVETIFKENGFEVVYPEEMSFAKQLQLYSQADIIAGPSGSALANIMFTKSDAKLICILPKEVEGSAYSNIGGILGRKVYFLDAKLSEDFKPYYANGFTIDIDYLKDFLGYVNNM